MKKYEYKITTWMQQEGMNELGKQGWELVCTYETTLFFKRELKGE